MSSESRSLPSRPSLRHLRLEAKRCLAAGEFAGDTAAHSGVGLEATAFLRVRVRDLRTHVILTNRQIPLDSIDLGETDV